MNYIFKLSVRNVLKNKRRTILTFISVTLGLFLMIFSKALMEGVAEESTRNLINYETSHMKLFARGYFKDIESLPTNKLIENPLALEKKIMENKHVAGTTHRAQFAISMSDSINELPCIGLGIDIKKEADVFTTGEIAIDGKHLVENDDGVIIGKRLADDFSVKTGDWITITAWTTEDSINALDFEIKGIFKSNSPMLDGNVVIMPLKTADELIVLNGGVTEIDIKLKNGKKIEKAKQSLLSTINASGEIYEIIPWQKLAEDILQFITVKKYGGDMMGLIILIIAGVGIINTILMSVFERIKEIGMMMAMGMKPKEIRKLFMMEGFVIGLFGSIAGCVIGVLLTLAFSGGMDFSYAGDMMGEAFGVESIIYPSLTAGMVLAYFLLGIVLCTLASIYPSIKASKFEPVEALRK